MTDAHRPLRESLGAYALGRLDPADRAALEAHLATCGPCREELASLAPLPGLLRGIDPDALPPRPELPDAVRDEAVRRLAAARRRARWRLRAWQAVAAAAVLALVVVLAAPRLGGDGGDRPEGRQLALEPVAVDATQVAGQATAYAWEWGTTIELDLRSLPDRPAFRVVAVDDAGDRQPVGGWTATAGAQVRWRGGCGIATDALQRVEVTDPDGEVVLALVTG